MNLQQRRVLTKNAIENKITHGKKLQLAKAKLSAPKVHVLSLKAAHDVAIAPEFVNPILTTPEAVANQPANILETMEHQVITFDRTNNKRVLCCIVCHNENANCEYLLDSLEGAMDTKVIDCASAVKNNRFILCDNLMFGGAYNKAIELMIEGGYDWLLFFAGDVQIDKRNMSALINEVNMVKQSTNIGVWVPCTTQDSHDCGENRYTGSNMMYVTKHIDGYATLVRADVVKNSQPAIKEIVLGWGIDWYERYEAQKLGLMTVADDSVCVKHPWGTSYNASAADLEAIAVKRKYYPTFERASKTGWTHVCVYDGITTNIYICTHKDFVPSVSNPAYHVIKRSDVTITDSHGLSVVQTNEDNSDFSFQRSYGETYFLLHNDVPKCDNVGYCHYRRYFTEMDDIYKINAELISHKAIVFNHAVLSPNIARHYAMCHNGNDIIEVFNYAKEYYPDRVNEIDDFLVHNQVFYPCNSFITKYDIYMELKKFLLYVFGRYNAVHKIRTQDDVVNYVQNNLDKFHNRDVQYQARLHGFLGERLTSFFFKHVVGDVIESNMVLTNS